MMPPDVPHRGCEGADQPARKNSTSLQRADTENVARVSDVSAPVVDDVENLRAHNSAEHDQDAEVPRFVGIDPLPRRVAHADPKSDQDSGGDQQPVSREEESSNMKELGVHVLLDARQRISVPY